MKFDYGLFKHSTENIGDEIQSIAARRFLPRVDEYTDRDELRNFHPKKPTKLIMNGWHNRKPAGWPPNDENIVPLLVSMHVSTKDPRVVKQFLSKKSVEFLKKYGPVGARDTATEEFFRENDIPTYFSGCITLTLQKDPDLEKQDFILAVDLPKKVVEAMRKRTKRRVIEISVYHFPKLSREERFAVAEYFLSLYQMAAAVVTTRLHAMLPSLALETPVLLIKDNKKYEPKRYGGLDDLVRSATEAKFLKDASIFDLENPTPNGKAYQKIRRDLIKRCKEFTGYDNQKSFRSVDLTVAYKDPKLIEVFAFGWSNTFPKALLEGDVKWKTRQYNDLKRILARERLERKQNQDKIEKENEILRQELNSIYSSRTWRWCRRARRAIRKLKG